MPYLSYHEPGITTILSLTSFLLLLNGVRHVLDHFLYCGLIGEILIGIIWGCPVGGTAWLTQGTQETIQAFGYLGLIGLVFEGGLSTDLALLKKSAFMSISVATIGLLMPIALSFILLHIPFSASSETVYPTPLAAFSAGASLCSTSLGTTFAILSSAGMQKTRVGVVLVGATMMDDVVGLVMVNIVTTLGSGRSEPWPIARPIVASFGMFLVTMLVCPYVLKPVWAWVLICSSPSLASSADESQKKSLQMMAVDALHNLPHLSFVIPIAVLIIFVVVASFIDASVLFSAFIAGGVVNYLWEDQPRSEHQPQLQPQPQPQDDHIQPDLHGGPSRMYNQYLKSVMEFVLVPFFFGSIGFSIPITSMFKVSIVWKGILYAVIMIVAKALVGSVIYFEYLANLLRQKKQKGRPSSVPRQRKFRNHTASTNLLPAPSSALNTCIEEPTFSAPHAVAMLVAFAMISRGEIGFLIASLSQSSGTLTQHKAQPSPSQDEQIFLVIIWAVTICTVAGPIGVGIVVKRLRQDMKSTNASEWI